MGAERNQWLFPPNVADKVIGWRSNGQGLENKGPFATPDDLGEKQDTVSFATKTAAEAFDPDTAPDYIRTAGYAAAGDGGGALYKKVASEPSHAGKFQSADGTWWEITGPTITPQMFGALGSGDDATELQNFLSYVAAVRVENAMLVGDFSAGSPLELDLEGSPTEALHFNCTIQATGSNEGFLLTINRAVGTVLTGKLELLGTGDATYSNRTWGSGLLMTGCARMRAGGAQITTRYFKYYGTFIEGDASGDAANGSLADHGSIRALSCGSTAQGNGAKAQASFSARSDTGSSGSTGQRSVLTVDALPSAAVRDDNPIVVYDGEPYTVISYDTGASTITVYPWLSGSDTSGMLDYIEGAGVYAKGADANVLKFDMVEGSSCAVAYRNRGLYGGIAHRVVAQNCGVGIVAGNPPSSSSWQSTVINPYFELNLFDIVQVSEADQKSVIINPTALDFSKCFGRQPRVTGGALSGNFTKFNGISILKDGAWFLDTEGRPDGTNGSSTVLTLGPASETARRIRSNTHTVTLTDDDDMRRIFGYRDARCVIQGTGARDAPTGTITIARDTGYTINGSASNLALTGLPGPILIEALLVETDWRVNIVPLHLASIPLRNAYQTVATDAAFTLTPTTSAPIVKHTGTLTADRAVTLSTTGAVAGETRFRITRTGSGAFNLNVGSGPLKALATNTWAEFVYDGSAYYLAAYGAL